MFLSVPYSLYLLGEKPRIAVFLCEYDGDILRIDRMYEKKFNLYTGEYMWETYESEDYLPLDHGSDIEYPPMVEDIRAVITLNETFTIVDKDFMSSDFKQFINDIIDRFSYPPPLRRYEEDSKFVKDVDSYYIELRKKDPLIIHWDKLVLEMQDINGIINTIKRKQIVALPLFFKLRKKYISLKHTAPNLANHMASLPFDLCEDIINRIT